MGPFMEAPFFLGEALWVMFQMLVLLVLVVGVIALVTRGRAGRRPAWAHTAEDVLYERYRRGELTRQQYLDALLDVRQDRQLWGYPRRQDSPLELLRARYAAGELTRDQYVDAQVDILKDRYVQGELDVQEYEARLDVLLQDPRKNPRRHAQGA